MNEFFAALPARALDLLIFVAFVAAAINFGWFVLARARWWGDSLSEHLVFAFGIGAALSSFVLAVMGGSGQLRAEFILAWLGIGVALTFVNAASLRDAWLKRRPTRVRYSLGERVLLMGLILLLIPYALITFLPPTEVDALGYHLVAPALFLEQHDFAASFTNIGVNYPMGVQILFTFALAAGTDSATQLIHFSFALATTLGLYAFATRYFSRRVGLWAMLIFWTSPLIGLVASAPLIDHGLTFYQFLAVYAFFRWHETRARLELIWLGVAFGMALAIKYLGVIMVGVIGALVWVETWRHSARRWRALVENTLFIAIVALVLAAPWYLKNLYWFGNPIYPFITGYIGLDGSVRKPTGEMAGLGDWVGMGMGHDLTALLLFPVNIYLHWERFGVVTNRGGPSWFLLTLPLYLFVPKRAVLNWLWLICALQFATWFPFAQNLRYLMGIFPWLAIIAAYVIVISFEWLTRRTLRRGWTMLLGVAYGIALFLAFGFLLILHDTTLPYLAGQVSREEFLDANLVDYRAVRYMNTMLPANTRVLALGDGRVYYAQRDLLPDDTHSNWMQLARWGGSPAGVAEKLRALGVTHIWTSMDELLYNQNYWSLPNPWQDPQVPFAEFEKRYLRMIYADERGHTIYVLHP